MLTWTELESITDDYFIANGGTAEDIYFNTSFLLNYLMKQKKGLWERPEGGERIRVPLEYDGQEADFYSKGATISSDDRESVNSAYFEWKHAYGNATVYRIDGLKNAGRYAEVQMLGQRVSGAQKSLTKLIAGSIYDLPSGSSERLTGLRALCHETSTIPYGGIQEDDLVSKDGTKPWEGKMDAATTVITLGVIRTGASDAKTRDGKGGKPDLVVTTEANWNIIADILQTQQRFTDGKETAKAGFTGLHFEGKDIFPDDFCPTNHLFEINSNHVGFAIHQDGYMMRSKWKVIPDSPEDRTLKIYWDGNAISNNRKAHKGYSALSL